MKERDPEFSIIFVFKKRNLIFLKCLGLIMSHVFPSLFLF